MDSQITVQIDPNTGEILISIPANLVSQLGWRSDSTIVWTLDPEKSSLMGVSVKQTLDDDILNHVILDH